LATPSSYFITMSPVNNTLACSFYVSHSLTNNQLSQ
jgi:hypothetical protein